MIGPVFSGALDYDCKAVLYIVDVVPLVHHVQLREGLLVGAVLPDNLLHTAFVDRDDFVYPAHRF
jgi:hypothetical protein